MEDVHEGCGTDLRCFRTAAVQGRKCDVEAVVGGVRMHGCPGRGCFIDCSTPEQMGYYDILMKWVTTGRTSASGMQVSCVGVGVRVCVRACVCVYHGDEPSGTGGVGSATPRGRALTLLQRRSNSCCPGCTALPMSGSVSSSSVGGTARVLGGTLESRQSTCGRR